MQINGAQAVLKALEHEGVETVFGMPGGAILPVYDPLIESSIRHILVRHEQGAGHMAIGLRPCNGQAWCRDRDERPGRNQHGHRPCSTP